MLDTRARVKQQSRHRHVAAANGVREHRRVELCVLLIQCQQKGTS